MSAKKQDEKKSVETPAKQPMEMADAEADAQTMDEMKAEIAALKEEKAKAEEEAKLAAEVETKVAADAAKAAKKSEDKSDDPLHYPEGQMEKKVEATPAPKGKTYVRSVAADGNYRWDWK